MRATRVLRLSAQGPFADGSINMTLRRLLRAAVGAVGTTLAAAAPRFAAQDADALLEQLPQADPSLPAPAFSPAASRHRHHAAASASCLVARVTYPANDPLEDRYDFRDAAALNVRTGAATTSTAATALSVPFQVPPGAVSMPRVLAAVLDGHGGWQAAEFARRQLLDAVELELENSDRGTASPITSAGPADPDAQAAVAASQVGGAMVRAFMRVDRRFIAAVRPAFDVGFGELAHVGCCAIAAAVLPRSIVVANAGDCRAVLGRLSYADSSQPPALPAAPLAVPLFLPLADGSGGGGDGSDAALSTPESPSASDYAAHSAAAASPSPRALTGVWFSAGGAWSTPPYFFSAVPLSRDHNAREPRERARLLEAHPGERDIVLCKVGNTKACYVKGRLQPTRSLGDAYLKESEFNVAAGLGRLWGRHIKPPYTPPYVTGVPELTSLALQPEGLDRASFLVLACDGVWDMMSSNEVVKFVGDEVNALGGPQRASARDLEGIAERLKEVVLQKAAEAEGMLTEQLRQLRCGSKGGRRDYHDDITALVLFIGPDFARPRPGRASGGPDGVPEAAAVETAPQRTSWRLWG